MKTIYNLSHYDLDGCVSNLLVKAAFRDNKIKTYCCGYEKLPKKLDEIIRSLKKEPATTLIVTDFCLTQEQLELMEEHFEKIIIMDHHPKTDELTPSEKTKIIFDDTKAGALITYDKLQKRISDDKGQFQKLAELANDYDLWIHDDKTSFAVNCLFWNWHWWEFQKRFRYGFKHLTPNEKNIVKTLIADKKATFKKEEHHIFPEGINDAIIYFVDDFLGIESDITLFLKQYKFYFVYNKKIRSLHIRKGMKVDVNYNPILEKVVEEIGNEHIESFGGHDFAGAIIFKEDVSTDIIQEVVASIYDLANKNHKLLV